MKPTVITFWICLTASGYVIGGDMVSAAIGLAVGTGLSLLLSR